MATLIKGRKQEEAIAFAQSQYNAVWVNDPNGSCGWEVKGMSDDQFRHKMLRYLDHKFNHFTLPHRY